MPDAPRTQNTPASAGRPPTLAEPLGAGRPFLVGIGGCGMSALARVLASDGLPVRGVDAYESDVTQALAAAGVGVHHDESASGLPDDADGLIISAAVRPTHAMVLEAERRGLPILTYAEALGRCQAARTGISVAGTHGKSTTTAMLGSTLTDCGLDPTVIVGATCEQLAKGAIGTGAPAPAPVAGTTPPLPIGFRLGALTVPAGTLAGRPGFLAAEACEFNRSFHHHRPLLASIANVEADHLDIYGSLDEVVQAFAEFARLIPPESAGGRLLIGHDGAHRREITAGLPCHVQTIGFAPSADWVVSYRPDLRTVELRGPGNAHARWPLALPGEHMAFNSAVAATLAHYAGADLQQAAQSLAAFRGLDRRMQYMGERPHVLGGVVRVYDDYGHHPTEVDVTLRALRQHERPHERNGRLVVVFQPHQHSRTRFLLEEFAASFSQADVVIVPHIYFVRDSEAEKHKVSSADLVDRLRKRGVRAMHLYPFEAIVEQLENLCRPGDVLVVMGAGPVWQVARSFLSSGRG